MSNETQFPIMPSNKLIDVSRHEGARVKVEKIEKVDLFTQYDLSGTFVKGLKRPVKKLKVSTVILEVIPREGKAPIELRATELFGLKQQTLTDGQIIWGVSDAPKSELFQFMHKQKVDSVEALVGTLVTVTVRSSTVEGDDREFLGFAR